MHNVIFSEVEGDFLKKLINAYSAIGLEQDEVICEDLDLLFAKLRDPSRQRAFVTIISYSVDGLRRLHRNRSLFEGQSLLLLLSGTAPTQIEYGHALNPRFLGFIDANLEHIAQIARRSFDIHEQQDQAWEGGDRR